MDNKNIEIEININVIKKIKRFNNDIYVVFMSNNG